MMSCKGIQPMLDAYRTNELASQERMLVESHLQSCPACASELRIIQDFVEPLKGLRSTAPAAVGNRVVDGLGDRIGRVSTVLGDVWIAFNDRGISLLWLGEASESEFAATCLQRLGRRVTVGAVPERLVRSVEGAAAGQWSADVAVDLSAAAPFERAVLEKLREIPSGEVRPYAWVAREIGAPKAVRAVHRATPPARVAMRAGRR